MPDAIDDRILRRINEWHQLWMQSPQVEDRITTNCGTILRNEEQLIQT